MTLVVADEPDSLTNNDETVVSLPYHEEDQIAIAHNNATKCRPSYLKTTVKK